MKKSFIQLLLAAVVLLGCQREVRQSSLGESTSDSKIQAAQRRSLSKLNPYTIKKGQRVHTAESQEIISSQGPAKFISKEWVTEVTDVEDLPDVKLITTNKKVTDKVWDENFVYEFKNVYTLAQIDTLDLLDQLNQNSYSLQSILKSLKENVTREEPEIKGIAYHNLREKTVSMVPPKLVKDADNCKDIDKCRVQADQITYDIVFLMTDGSTRTHNIEWFISDEVPFFAAILKQCATTIVPVDNLRVLVKQCSEVVDFDE